MPVFSKYVNFKNEYSKKMFVFDNKYILLKIEKETDNDKQNSNNEKNIKPLSNMENLNVETPLQIGFQLAVNTWFRLEPLLNENYEPPTLEKERKKRVVKTIKLEGVIIDALKGKGVKFIFNGSYYWVPRSIVKYSYEDEVLEVPHWYARKENLL